MPVEQRGDARDTKSVRGVPWQQTSAETAEDELVSMACVCEYSDDQNSPGTERGQKLVGF